MTWGQVNRQRLLPCHNLWDLKEQKGFFEFREKGKSHKQEELLWDIIKKLPKELITELHYLELPAISAFYGVKIYMHYVRFRYLLKLISKEV